MKWFRRTFALLFLALFFLSSERFVHQITEGFTLLNIRDSYPFDPKWEPSSPQIDWEQIRPITKQKFRFLRAGGQNYAFMSEDGQYVLKVTKYKRMRIPIWIEPLPLPHSLNAFREKKIAKKKRILDSTFASYLIAFDYLRDYSGIVYLHLNRTSHLHQDLTLVDLLGIEHKISLDEHAFILQKRGELTFSYFDHVMLYQEREKAEEMLKEIVHYVAHRISLCIEDHDIGFGTNFGVLDNKPFQLDIGSLRFNASFATVAQFNSKFEESLVDLDQWLKVTHPSLLPCFYQCINDVKRERARGITSFSQPL